MSDEATEPEAAHGPERTSETVDELAAIDEAATEGEPPSAEDVGLEETDEAVAADEEPNQEGQTILRSDAPGVPWAIDLRSSITHYTPTPDGGMIVQFTIAVPTPQGAMLMPPAVLVRFRKEGWEAFQKEVAAGGVKAMQIATAKVVPQPPGGNVGSRIVHPGRRGRR